MISIFNFVEKGFFRAGIKTVERERTEGKYGRMVWTNHSCVPSPLEPLPHQAVSHYLLLWVADLLTVASLGVIF